LRNTTYLSPNLEHVFERHTRICEFILQKNDHIVTVLLYLFLLGRFGAAQRFTLLDICLKCSNLLVDTRNVLFDDESEFLTVILGVEIGKKSKAEVTYANLDWPVVKQSLAFSHYK
jgi:hypothetical protein